MAENSTLRIHTQLAPQSAPEPGGENRRERVRYRGRRRAGASRPGRARPGFTDRLLRNSAIACAVLLGILALGNIRQPWAEKAAEGIERALTMHINLDDSIGELTFVRRLMPESALVFLNVAPGTAMSRPAEGALKHGWSAVQPWLLFEAQGAPAVAADSGTIAAISPMSGGGFGLLVDHGEGLESVYAGLDEVSVQTGDSVSRGQQLGLCGDELYFELRQDGESADPSERLGL